MVGELTGEGSDRPITPPLPHKDALDDNVITD